MKTIQKFTLGILSLIVVSVSAQEIENTETIEDTVVIEDFQLPTFTELSNSIASEYSQVRERLPNLSTIGEHVDKELRRGLLSEHNIAATFRNLTPEYSILPNITQKRFQLRNSLNNIMFNGFDANQLHLMDAWRGGQ